MTTYTYTDLYADAYSSLYGQLSPASQPVFPQVLLAIKVELLLNGTWTDITTYCYQRDMSVAIVMTDGRPDESSKLVTSTCTVELNNRGGTFSPRNAASPFFPFLTRNTQIRVSTQTAFNGTDGGWTYEFWGEVSAWPPSWDVTGNDVWVDISASGITRRLNQQAKIGSALRRWYLTKNASSDPTYPVAYWPSEDLVNSTQLVEVTGGGTAATINGTPTLSSDPSFPGSDAIPVVNTTGWWTGAVNTYFTAGDLVFATPGTYNWTSPVTSADVICVASGGGGSWQTNQAGGGGAGEEAEEPALALTVGKVYTFTVPPGGQGATSGGALSSGGQDCIFQGDSVAVHAHGGTRGSQTTPGTGGSGSTNTNHHNGGNGYYATGVAGGGGSAGGLSAAGNNATSAAGAAPVAYGGPGGDGGTAGSGGGSGTTQNYVKSYTATASYCFAGSDGHFPNTKIQTNVQMTQGGDYADTFNGKCKTFIMFNASQIASDLSGATITKVTLRLKNDHSWYNSGMTVSLGWDTGSHSGSTNTDPTLHNSLKEYGIGEGATTTQDIGTQFGTAFQSGGATCLKLFKNSNSLTYYGYFDGPSQSTPPVMTIYYSK